MKKALPLLFFSLLFIQSSLFAQHARQLGFNWMNDKDGYHTYAPGIGLQWVIGTGKFTSFETGIYYKTFATRFTGLDVNNQLFNADNITHNILLPARFRVGHKWLRIQAGADIAIFLSSTIKDKLSPRADIAIKSRAVTIRPILGIATPWKLTGKWIIEPGITASAPIPDGGVTWGLNIGIRKILTHKEHKSG